MSTFGQRQDRGATAVEYAILVGLIAGAIVLGVTAFGLAVKSLFDAVPPL